MLVGEAGFVELRLELFFEHFGEQVFELAVVGLQDRVLRAEIHRILALQAVVERRARKIADARVVVVHAHHDAAIFELRDFHLDGLAAILRNKRHRHGASAGHFVVGGAVLVAVRVTADDNRLVPVRHESRHVLDDDRLAEHHAIENVADGAVRRLPHLFQVELFDARFVGGDGGALDAHAVLQDGVRRVDGDLVVGLVAIFDAEVVVIELEIEIREDEAVFDERPDNAGHFIAIKVDDRGGYFDLLHASTLLADGLCME